MGKSWGRQARLPWEVAGKVEKFHERGGKVKAYYVSYILMR